MNGYNFTERVRKVLAMAREESVRLHHEYVGTEHQLLGLLREGEGVGVTAMKNLGADLDQLRQRIEAAVQAGPPGRHVGPDLPYSSRAKKALELAMSEARALSHSYVGTEHLLLGLLREEQGIAAQVLVSFGVSLDRARAEVLRILGTSIDEGSIRATATSVAVTRRSPLSRARPRSLRDGQFIPLGVDDGTSMQAFVVSPTAAGRKPGLIVFQEAYGVNDHIRDVAARFAAQGFVVIAPELYHRTGTHVEGPYGDFAALGPHFNAVNSDTIAADSRAAHAWLVSQPEVDPTRIATIGYCMGGRAAFVANLELPLAAAVTYYGGGIAPALLDRVAQLHAPHLFCWGGKDTHIPPEQTRAIDDALRAADKPYTTVTFGEAGHAFFCDQRADYRPAAAAEAWALTIAFFARTVGIAAPRT
jgi:carboxymethylenebutenolidase